MLGRQIRGVIAIVLCAAGLLPLIFRPVIPASWVLRLVVDSFLPWVWVPLLIAVLLALTTRSFFVIAVSLVPVIVWSVVFVPRILPLDAPAASTSDLTLVTQNIGSDASAIGGILSTITAEKPQVIALQEVTTDTAAEVTSTLSGDGYGYQTVTGTVGVWSTVPIKDVEPLTLGIGWYRAIRLDLETSQGSVRLYVVHALSVRLGDYSERNSMIAALSALVAEDASSPLIVAGDFNATIDDAAMSQLTDTVTEPRMSSGGFGFTWPSGFPMTRPDHIFLRGLTATRSDVLAASGSDHRGILVSAVF